MLASPEWLRTTGHLQVLWSARSDAKAQTGRFFSAAGRGLVKSGE